MFGIVKNGKFSTENGTPSLDKMQEVVDGYICTALRYPSPSRKGVTIDVYCNDDGLNIDLPIHLVRHMDGSPIAGDIIIAATRDRSGETISATEDELKAWSSHFQVMAVPMSVADLYC